MIVVLYMQAKSESQCLWTDTNVINNDDSILLAVYGNVAESVKTTSDN